MECYYCKQEAEYRKADDSLDFYRHIEGRPISSRSYHYCNKCGSSFDGRLWSKPYKLPELLATRNQIKLLEKLFTMHRISKYAYDNLLFREHDDESILISKFDANRIIQTLNKIKDWEKEVNEFLLIGCQNDYLRKAFNVTDDFFVKLLRDHVEFV